MFGLAHPAKPDECFVRGGSSAAAQQADGLVDDRSGTQRLLQLGRECMGLGQKLGIVDGNCSRGCEQLAEVGGVLAECVLAVGVNIDRPNCLAGR